jgi:carbonic anhydrase
MNRFTSVFLLFALLGTSVALIAGCGGGNAPATPVVTKTLHWTYEGDDGPAVWGLLDPSYVACSAGKSQSPVNLAAPTSKGLPNIEFHYQPSALNILNNGHTVQVNYDAGSYIVIQGVTYNLVQFHFHAPSEHKLNGKTFAAELHLVHKSAAGQLAVVGVFLDNTAPADNPAFTPVFGNLPTTTTPVATITGVTVNAAAFLPTTQTTYRYSGSLTTPPCTEGVAWNVMTTPVLVSAAQAKAFSSLFPGGDARPVQSGNGRELDIDTTP